MKTCVRIGSLAGTCLVWLVFGGAGRALADNCSSLADCADSAHVAVGSSVSVLLALVGALVTPALLLHPTEQFGHVPEARRDEHSGPAFPAHTDAPPAVLLDEARHAREVAGEAAKGARATAAAIEQQVAGNNVYDLPRQAVTAANIAAANAEAAHRVAVEQHERLRDAVNRQQDATDAAEAESWRAKMIEAFRAAQGAALNATVHQISVNNTYYTMRNVDELTPADRATIRRYTDDDKYMDINKKLIENDPKNPLTPEETGLVEELQTALAKIPPYVGIVYRGACLGQPPEAVDSYVRRFKEGEVVTVPEFMSASNSPASRFGGPVQIEIYSESGVSIEDYAGGPMGSTEYQKEREVIFTANQQYYCLSKELVNDKWVIRLFASNPAGMEAATLPASKLQG